MTQPDTPGRQFVSALLGGTEGRHPTSAVAEERGWWREFWAVIAGRAGAVGDSARSRPANDTSGWGSEAFTSANEYIAALQSGEMTMRGELVKMQDRFEAMRKQWGIERVELTEALDNERRQVARLSGYLARCKADLAVAESQIEQLTRYDRPSAGHGRPPTE